MYIFNFFQQSLQTDITRHSSANDADLQHQKDEVERKRKSQLANDLFAGMFFSSSTTHPEVTGVTAKQQPSSLVKAGPLRSNLSSDSGYMEQSNRNGAAAPTRPNVGSTAETTAGPPHESHTDNVDSVTGSPSVSNHHHHEPSLKLNIAGRAPSEDWRNISSNLKEQDHNMIPKPTRLSLADDDNSSIYSDDSLSTSPKKSFVGHKALGNLMHTAVGSSQAASMYDQPVGSLYGDVASDITKTNICTSMQATHDTNVYADHVNTGIGTSNNQFVSDGPRQLDVGSGMTQSLLESDMLKSPDHEYTQEWLHSTRQHNSDSSNRQNQVYRHS